MVFDCFDLIRLICLLFDDHDSFVFLCVVQVLDLIEARGKRAKFGAAKSTTVPPPMGLLAMLDEEGRIVGGSDTGFFNKIRRTHEKNVRLKFKGPTRNQRTSPTEFWVRTSLLQLKDLRKLLLTVSIIIQTISTTITNNYYNNYYKQLPQQLTTIY